ncbi:MAG TPA: hypothetical protein VMS89_02340 [Methanoregulaceae archaeon]|nr:hypothetical protein [Methanoregulaceae archaeon]
MLNRILLLVPALLIVLFVLTGPVSASVPPENTPEIQNLVTATGVDAVGTVTHDNNLAWRLSSEVLDANLNFGENQAILNTEGTGHWNGIPDPDNSGVYIGWVYVPEGNGQFDSSPFPNLPPGYQYWTTTAEPPLNPAGEVQMASYYNENTMAVNGATTYTKDMGIVSSPQTIDKFNVKAGKIVTFSALDAGRMTSGEELLQDNVGNATSLVAFISDCPFAHGAIGNCAPPFCNIIKSGSDLDVSEASVATSAMVRSVAENAASDGSEFWPPKPRVDGPPVELDYSISLHGISADPAVGDVSAYVNIHKQEAGPGCPGGGGRKDLDLQYNEQSTANGLIQNFQKTVAYQSGYKITI